MGTGSVYGTLQSCNGQLYDYYWGETWVALLCFFVSKENDWLIVGCFTYSCKYSTHTQYEIKFNSISKTDIYRNEGGVE